MHRFFATNRSTLLLFQRVVLGLVMFPHGAQKLLGWYGGGGWAGTMGYFTGMMGVPAPLAMLVIVSEFFGSIALVLGLCTRLAAFGTTATMVGAMLLVHLPVGFFMNWGGTQAGEGYEYHLLALALALPLIVRGGGALSVDRILARRAAGGAGGGQTPSSHQRRQRVARRLVPVPDSRRKAAQDHR